MNTIILIIVGFLFYLLGSFVFGKLFYNGKLDHENRMVFNLSIFAEMIMIILYSAIGIYEIYRLSTSLPIWYDWILPVIWIFIFLIKGVSIFANRNNFFKISGNNFQYRAGSEKGSIKFDSYRFYSKESNAPTIGKTGIYLELRTTVSEKEQTMEFDLKDLNLEGFKNAIEKYFEKLDIKKHYI